MSFADLPVGVQAGLAHAVNAELEAHGEKP